MRKRGCRRRIGLALLVFLAAMAAAVWAGWLWPLWGAPFNQARHTQAPRTPAWALECWLWEDDVNTAERVWELLDGYERHDIPVRTILIDSPWSTRYNDFIVDELRYPEPTAFFSELEARGYRVVLWMTNMVNSRNSDTAIEDSSDWYDGARANGYLVDDGYQVRWWKGMGGFIDYTNPAAMAWWRGLQQQAFDWGIDGWKLDGTATLLLSRLGPLPFPWSRAHSGRITTRQYMDLYYRKEYQHGLEANPEFVTLSRSLDSPMPWAHPEGFAPLDASPVNWVGDNTHTWGDKTRGLERALRMILRSAELGYNVIGSDVGGYHGGTPIPPELYVRWAQFSTFCGLFLNGGHGERRLWERSPEELELIRRYAWLHTELVPYMYSHVVACAQGGPPLMRPVEGKYQYLFGDAFLVAPIYEDRLEREVVLPQGRWHYFFGGGDPIEAGPEGHRFSRRYSLEEFPVYVRDGAIIPLEVSREYTGLGSRDSEGYVTWLVYPGGAGRFVLHHPDGSGQTALRVQEGPPLRLTLEGLPKPALFRVARTAPPQRVKLNGVGHDDWWHDSGQGQLWIRHTAGNAAEFEVE